MRTWEDGTARVAREEIDAVSGPTPVRFNQSIAQIVDGPVRFRRLESNDLLAESVIQAAMVELLMEPFDSVGQISEAARASLMGEAASFICSAQLLAEPESREVHIAYGKQCLGAMAEELRKHDGRVTVTVVRRRLKAR